MTGYDTAVKIQEVTISVNGTFRNGMFSAPHFEGFVELDIYDSTIATWVNINFERNTRVSRSFRGFMRYIQSKPSVGEVMIHSGFFHTTDSEFSTILINHLTSIDGNPFSNPSRMIIAPATDKESAKLVMQGFGLHWTGAIMQIIK